MIAAPRPVIQGELAVTSAEEVFLSAGFDAVAGFPLPKSGLLPVYAKGLGTVLMSPEAWEAYVGLCSAERATRQAAAAVPVRGRFCAA